MGGLAQSLREGPWKEADEDGDICPSGEKKLTKAAEFSPQKPSKRQTRNRKSPRWDDQPVSCHTGRGHRQITGVSVSLAFGPVSLAY